MQTAQKTIRRIAACMAMLLLPQIGIANPFSHHISHARQMPANSTRQISDTAADYAYSLPLSVNDAQGVVGFQLSKDVYLHAQSASLDDLRLFNSAGTAVPFALHVPPLRQHIEHRSLPVKIFPITSDRSPSSGETIALDVRTNADGTLLSVKTGSKEKSATKDGKPEAASLVGLVLDLGQPGATGDQASEPLIDALRFTLPATMQSYSAQVWLEVSDDLKQWDAVGTTELNWLVNREAQTLANDRLEFEPRRFRYARLTWRSGIPLQFEAITAETIARNSDTARFDTLLLRPEAGRQAGDLVYRAGIALPVEKISLQFDESNIVLPAAFGTYREIPSRQPGKADSWMFATIGHADFYRITQAGQQRRAEDVRLPPTHIANWVIRPRIPGNRKPALRLSWQPATLIFLADGSGPYTLAFGRRGVDAVRLDLSEVAPGFTEQEVRHLQQAKAGPVRQRQGPAPEDQDGDASGRMRLWALWGVLLLGVAVLGVLARRLIKQMA